MLFWPSMKHLATPLLGFMMAVAGSAEAEPARGLVAINTDGASAGNRIRVDRVDEPPSRERGVREHDGFYLRFGLGFGGVTDAMQSEDEYADGEHHQGTVSGMASVGEFMIGGTIGPRLILGGGLWTSTAFVSVYSRTNGDGIPSDLRQPDNFTIVGPFADWYLGTRPGWQESGGFHAQAGLGLAVLNGLRPEQLRHDEPRVAVGPGLMLGFGYEWWVGDQWAIGALARLTAAGLVEQDEREDLWYHGVATFPAFLLTATYN